ncbi:succinate dehydrogenase assembly factor 2 [Seohaeicola zhoushanensis]|nr:succinate dehydrogenase assembly factor 2 [Seohaeicola zhoushanensis]
MRAMRRGIREMDLILSAWADIHLDALPEDRLDLFDALLSENDQDLYAWVTGRDPAPERFAAMVDDVAQIFQKQG